MPWKLVTSLTDSLRRTNKQAVPSDSPDSANASTRPSKTNFGMGAVIDARYRLDAELGKGGMGVVYRAHDILNDRQAAIKIMSTGGASVSALEQFLREARVMAMLDHPHIVSVYAIGTADTGARIPSPFIAMEYVGGQNLSELRGLVFTQIVDLGRQICARAVCPTPRLRAVWPGQSITSRQKLSQDSRQMLRRISMHSASCCTRWLPGACLSLTMTNRAYSRSI